MKERLRKKLRKENGEPFKDEDIICLDFGTLSEIIVREKKDTAFSYMKKFRDETQKIKESIPSSIFTGYLDGIDLELRDFYVSKNHE